jgi:hypothetical protein
MKKLLILVFAALLCSAVVVPALAQPLPDELIIHPWTLPQHFCIYMVPGENMEVFIVGGPMPPNSPEFTVTAGCDQVSTDCQDPTCIPILPEFSSWTYDMATGKWHATLFYMSGPAAGCACISYEGWTYGTNCNFPYTEVDMGDLEACNYGTQLCNPSHGLSGIAWLGPNVNGEAIPNILNLDQFDDGVIFHSLPWNPCDPVSVTVTVTAGPNYSAYVACEGQLYLNAWKDGNRDLDFCDELVCPDGSTVSEWVIQDVQIFNPGPQLFTFIDPGVFYLGWYDLKMRFRLTSTPVGRYGHSWLDPETCPDMPCGTFGHDVLGEVEDYIWDDSQLAVELMNFGALAGDGVVTLNWTTASETNNDHFEIMRDGTHIGDVSGAGTIPTENEYSWIDEHVVNGTSYAYTLAAVDESGASEEIARAEATPSRTAGIASGYALYQNYPNPFNSQTSIIFDLAEDNFVSLKVFNLMGQEIETLLASELTTGRHEVVFDAANLATGIYFYQLEAGSFTTQRKLVLIK